MMKTYKLMSYFLILLVLLPVVLASSLDVQVTDSKELAFTITSDSIGWQKSQINIFDKRGDLVYEFEDNIYFSMEPAFELLNCPDCKAGKYFVIANIDGEELSSEFYIQNTTFEWFWLIAFTLVLGLAFLANYLLKQSLVKPKHKKKTSPKNKKTKKAKK